MALAAPEWERYTAWIEADATAKKNLGERRDEDETREDEWIGAVGLGWGSGIGAVRSED